MLIEMNQDNSSSTKRNQPSEELTVDSESVDSYCRYEQMLTRILVKRYTNMKRALVLLQEIRLIPGEKQLIYVQFF